MFGSQSESRPVTAAVEAAHEIAARDAGVFESPTVPAHGSCAASDPWSRSAGRSDSRLTKRSGRLGDRPLKIGVRESSHQFR